MDPGPPRTGRRAQRGARRGRRRSAPPRGLPREPRTGAPVGDHPYLFEIVGVHGWLHDYLFVLVYVLRADRLNGADEQPWREEKLPRPGPAAGDDVVALLNPRAQINVLDAEIPFEVGPEETFAVGCVLGCDGGAELARGGGELGGGNYPDPGLELPVGDEHDNGLAAAYICGAPDERVLADDDGHLGLDAVFGAYVYLDPVGELVAHRCDHPREGPVLVEGALPFEQLAQPRVLKLQARGLSGELPGLLQLALQRLLLARVEGALDPLPRLLNGRGCGGDRAPYRRKHLRGAELDRVQRPRLALLHVDGEEPEAHHAEDKESRQTTRCAGLPPPHYALV